MNNDDPFSPEASDPFYVPARRMELGNFSMSVGLSAMLPFMLGFPASTSNSLVLLLTVFLVLSSIFYGLKRRKYRLERTRAVAELRDAIRATGDPAEAASHQS